MSVVSLLEDILLESASKLREALNESQKIVFNNLYNEVFEDFKKDIATAISEREFIRTSIKKNPQRRLIEVKGSKERKLESVINEEISYISFEHPNINYKEDFVSVFLPVKHGKEKILQSLLGLKKELDYLENKGFGYELNICLNNSNDGTLDRVLKLSHLYPGLNLNIYELQKESLRAAGQIYCINFLYTLLSNKLSECGIDTHKVYIHTADDDIGYPPEHGGIFKNIVELRKDPKLKIISGTYTTSKITNRFHFLNSIRKDPKILKSINPLSQVYGGALTMRLQDFPQGGLPSNTSYDCFITLYYLKDQLEKNADFGSIMQSLTPLPVRTNPHFIIEHQEEPKYIKFVWRLLRDINWRKKSVKELKNEQIEYSFLKIRRAYYDSITREIENLPDEDHSKIGQKWMRLMRDRIYKLQEEGKLRIEDVESILPLGISQNEQRFCHELVKNKPKLEEVICLLKDNALFDSQSIDELKKPELSEKIKFKYIEKAIIGNKDGLKEKGYLGSPAIHILYNIVESTSALRSMLAEKDTIRLLFSKAGIELGKNIIIERQSKLGGSNFSFFISSENGEYFVRYHDPLGFKYFQRHEPRKTTFNSILCEQIFGELLGSNRVMCSLFPNLETAVKNYFGQEETNPVEKIAQSVLIQRDVRRECVELINYEKIGLDLQTAVEIYSKVLAEYHANSFGIARHYNNQSHRDKRVMQLLDIVGDDIRFSSPDSYGTWLKDPNWATRIFKSLEDKYHQENPIYHGVKAVLKSKGRDVQQIFDKLCDRSVKRFGENGSIGHLDYKINNLFARKDNPYDVKIYDFDYITFVDPAYELGQSLYSVIKHAMLKHIDNYDNIEQIINRFNEVYSKRFLEEMEKGNFAGEHIQVDMTKLLNDSNLFAGITTLGVFATEYKQYGLECSQVETIKKICLELLK